MRDIVLTCCKDEEDVIDSFIYFYLSMGFDAIYVVNNGSEDRTNEILSQVTGTGASVKMIHDTRIGYERFLTEYYQWASEDQETGWIFFLDCDEFILFPKGCKRYLESLDQNVNCLRFRQREMYPLQNLPVRRGQFLLSTHAQPGFDDTTKDISKYHPNARVYAGKHLIEYPGKVTITPEDLYIRHFKYRNPEQAAKKEFNRIRAQSSYTEQELNQISAFRPGVIQQWIEYCRTFQKNRGWVSYFTEQMPWVEDAELAQWAVDFLSSCPINNPPIGSGEAECA